MRIESFRTHCSSPSNASCPPRNKYPERNETEGTPASGQFPEETRADQRRPTYSPACLINTALAGSQPEVQSSLLLRHLLFSPLGPCRWRGGPPVHLLLYLLPLSPVPSICSCRPRERDEDGPSDRDPGASERGSTEREEGRRGAKGKKDPAKERARGSL